MTTCQRCESERLVDFEIKCKDRFGAKLTNKPETAMESYVPDDLGFESSDGGDVALATLCLDCGQMQGTYPLPISWLENPKEEE